MADEYPEHEKLKLVKDKSQAIGDFLDWLSTEKGYELAVREKRGKLTPANVPIRRLLAEFFEIDENKLEDEKQAMLEKLRSGVVG